MLTYGMFYRAAKCAIAKSGSGQDTFRMSHLGYTNWSRIFFPNSTSLVAGINTPTQYRGTSSIFSNAILGQKLITHLWREQHVQRQGRARSSNVFYILAEPHLHHLFDRKRGEKHQNYPIESYSRHAFSDPLTNR